MRTLYSFATICVLSAAVALVLPACGGSDDPPEGTAGAAGAPAAADPAKGAPIYTAQCALCHGSDAKGGMGPNITMSTVGGIGSWTYQQFHDAVRLGKDKDGSFLCPFMAPFEEKDVAEVNMKDLYAYIGTLPKYDTPVRGSTCP